MAAKKGKQVTKVTERALPLPVSVTDEYLAAILEELKETKA